MEYTVAELRENILSKLFELGLNPKFKATPALSSALAEIDALITTIPLDKVEETSKVKQRDKAITYTCVDEEDNVYALGLTSYEPNSFKCFLLTEKLSIPVDDKPMHQRTVIEKKVSVEENNYLTISTLGSTIDNLNCEIGKCNNSVWQESKKYSSKGIMIKKEVNNFASTEIKEDFDSISIDSMLYIPRKSILASDDFIESLRTKRTLISREYLDTAYIYVDDKEHRTTFSSSVPLNQDNGLRDMFIDDIYLNGPKEVFIPPVEDWEIDLMITSESNPKVQEGLKSISSGRNRYSYDSNNNPNFERKGFNDDLKSSVNI